MNRPPFEVADIIRAAGKDIIEKQRSWLTGLHLKVLSAIEHCRTAALEVTGTVVLDAVTSSPSLTTAAVIGIVRSV